MTTDKPLLPALLVTHESFGFLLAGWRTLYAAEAALDRLPRFRPMVIINAQTGEQRQIELTGAAQVQPGSGTLSGGMVLSLRPDKALMRCDLAHRVLDIVNAGHPPAWTPPAPNPLKAQAA